MPEMKSATETTEIDLESFAEILRMLLLRHPGEHIRPITFFTRATSPITRLIFRRIHSRFLLVPVNRIFFLKFKSKSRVGSQSGHQYFVEVFDVSLGESFGACRRYH